MRFGIVEGEPGMFPDPIARFLRRLTRPLRRRDEPPPPPPETPAADDDPAPS